MKRIEELKVAKQNLVEAADVLRELLQPVHKSLSKAIQPIRRIEDHSVSELLSLTNMVLSLQDELEVIE